MKKIICLLFVLLLVLPLVVACADDHNDTPADTTTASGAGDTSSADTTAAGTDDPASIKDDIPAGTKFNSKVTFLIWSTSL